PRPSPSAAARRVWTGPLGSPPETSFWSARRPTPARATPSPRPAAGCRWWSSTGRSRSSDPTARARSRTCSSADTRAAPVRGLPMVELDGTVEVVGPDGPVPFLDLFQGRDELVVYQHMWYDGAPHQGARED